MAAAVTVDATWPAMGSDAHVVVHGRDERALLGLARQRVATVEARWSRFRSDSDVSRLNDRAGRPVRVDGTTLVLVELAMQAWRLTDGWFDPTVLGALEAWGYDDTFAVVRRRPPVRRRAATRRTGCGGIRIDPDTGTVTLPAEVGFDPGGIGKGLAADLVVRDLLDAGADGACVNLGGDLRVGGRPPDDRHWRVGHGGGGPVLGLASGGMATSTSARRRWRVGDGQAHHLVDPGSGCPAAVRPVPTTVVASSAWRAEVLATAVAVRGGQDIDAWVRARHGHLVDPDATRPIGTRSGGSRSAGSRPGGARSGVA